MSTTGELIEAGDTLIVRSYDDKCSYILQVNGEKKINKSRVSLKEIVGQPYGAVFELNNRKFQRVSETEQAATELYDPEDKDDVIETGTVEPLDNKTQIGIRGDNSTYVDTNTAQKLTNEDISRLKESGMSGTEIIKNLIQNSDTFDLKTDYAQAKWIKKKENKYRRRYKILRSNPMSICEASFDKNREKICSLRVDSLAQIISQSGIHSGENSAKFKTCRYNKACYTEITQRGLNSVFDVSFVPPCELWLRPIEPVIIFVTATAEPESYLFTKFLLACCCNIALSCRYEGAGDGQHDRHGGRLARLPNARAGVDPGPLWQPAASPGDGEPLQPGRTVPVHHTGNNSFI